MSDPDEGDGTRITLPYHRFKAMEGELDRLRADAAAAVQRTPTGESSGAALEALQAALPVVQFAVANLDPRTVRGWPAADLGRLAALLVELLPEHDVLAQALGSFARECTDVDGFRAERRAEAEIVLGRDGSSASGNTGT